MTYRLSFLSSTTALAALLLAGCSATGSAPAASQGFAAPMGGDDGIVIAETTLVAGVSRGNTPVGTTDDCAGPGLGIKVGSTTGSSHFLFDKNGEPCDAAQTLFDGRTAINQRAADPGITLNFRDNLGPVPEDELPGLKPLPTVRLKSELLPTADVEPAAGNIRLGDKNAPATPVAAAPVGPDPLVATLTSWERQDTVYASRSSEAESAAERDIANISKDIQAAREQENVSKLMATLREREREAQEAQRRHAETLARAQANRQVTEAAQQAWKQKEHELQSNLAATQARLAQFEELSSRLNADKAAREKSYQQKINTLSSDLKAAEMQADTSRRELVLAAAAKIAEAESLATAAKLQEQDIKLREAARLKAEAETMMDRALSIRAGQSVVVGGAQPAVPLALMETPIVLAATDQTLPEILTSILKLAAPQAGEWKADWQISPTARHILKEKWSLTAEAPVQQVLAQLQQQVKAAHGLSLLFTQFGQSRLLVVTDATPPAGEVKPK